MIAKLMSFPICLMYNYKHVVVDDTLCFSPRLWKDLVICLLYERYF